MMPLYERDNFGPVLSLSIVHCFLDLWTYLVEAVWVCFVLDRDGERGNYSPSCRINKVTLGNIPNSILSDCRHLLSSFGCKSWPKHQTNCPLYGRYDAAGSPSFACLCRLQYPAELSLPSQSIFSHLLANLPPRKLFLPQTLTIPCKITFQTL